MLGWCFWKMFKPIWSVYENRSVLFYLFSFSSFYILYFISSSLHIWMRCSSWRNCTAQHPGCYSVATSSMMAQGHLGTCYNGDVITMTCCPGCVCKVLYVCIKYIYIYLFTAYEQMTGQVQSMFSSHVSEDCKDTKDMFGDLRSQR